MLSRIKQWVHHHKQLFTHQAVLNAYADQKFDIYEPSISLNDAVAAELMNPFDLHGSWLERHISEYDERVWTAWHNASRWRLDIYAHELERTGQTLAEWSRNEYSKCMRLNLIQEYAAADGCVPFFHWLNQLEKPFEPIIWDTKFLLCTHKDIGQWAFDHIPDKLSTIDGKSHVYNILNAYEVQDYQAFYYMPLSASKPEDVLSLQNYMVQVFNFYLPPHEWDWKRRWTEYGDMRVRFTREDSYEKPDAYALNGVFHIPALLQGCPLDIQKSLCAFKNTRHYLESSEPTMDIDAKAIRHHFWEGDPGQGTPSAPVALLLSMVDAGSDPDVAMTMWLNMSDPSLSAPEMYPLNDHLLDVS